MIYLKDVSHPVPNPYEGNVIVRYISSYDVGASLLHDYEQACMLSRAFIEKPTLSLQPIGFSGEGSELRFLKNDLISRRVSAAGGLQALFKKFPLFEEDRFQVAQLCGLTLDEVESLGFKSDVLSYFRTVLSGDHKLIYYRIEDDSVLHAGDLPLTVDDLNDPSLYKSSLSLPTDSRDCNPPSRRWVLVPVPVDEAGGFEWGSLRKATSMYSKGCTLVDQDRTSVPTQPVRAECHLICTLQGAQVVSLEIASSDMLTRRFSLKDLPKMDVSLLCIQGTSYQEARNRLLSYIKDSKGLDHTKPVVTVIREAIKAGAYVDSDLKKMIDLDNLGVQG